MFTTKNGGVKRMSTDADHRPIPDDISKALTGFLMVDGRVRWMNTRITALGGRTPWECIDAGDKEAVLRLLASYQDPSFT